MAVIAHLGLGFFSAGHGARMLAASFGSWVNVCTASGIERIPLRGDQAPTHQDSNPFDAKAVRCPVCAAAAVGAPPPRDVSLQLPTFEYVAPSDATVADRRPAPYAGLRPPPRAPPRLS